MKHMHQAIEEKNPLECKCITLDKSLLQKAICTAHQTIAVYIKAPVLSEICVQECNLSKKEQT